MQAFAERNYGEGNAFWFAPDFGEHLQRPHRRAASRKIAVQSATIVCLCRAIARASRASAVDSRTTSAGSTRISRTVNRSFSESGTRFSKISCPICSRGICAVVSAGEQNSASLMLSNPVTDMSSGTRAPSSKPSSPRDTVAVETPAFFATSFKFMSSSCLVCIVYSGSLPPCILMYRERLLKLTWVQSRYIGLLIPSRDVQSPLTMTSARKYRPDASVCSSVSREQFRAPSFFRGAQPMTSHRPYSSELLADRLS